MLNGAGGPQPEGAVVVVFVERLGDKVTGAVVDDSIGFAVQHVYRGRGVIYAVDGIHMHPVIVSGAQQGTRSTVAPVVLAFIQDVVVGYGIA